MKRRLRWVGFYTVVFLAAFACCYGAMVLSGRSPVWQVDGRMQHYPFFLYIGRWLRLRLQGRAPAFDLALGLGADVRQSLNYYGLGDPLLMPIAFVFAGRSSAFGVFLLMVLRAWLAGLAAAALGRELGMDAKQRLAAGLLYAFSLGLFTAAQIRQWVFAPPYIHFPLMLLGVECALKKKKSWPLAVSTAIAATCGFYFLYANSLLMLLYALLRRRRHRAERLYAAFLRCLGWYLLGLGLAAAALLPALIGLFHGQRLDSGGLGGGLRLLFPLREYIQMPLTLLSGYTAGYVQMMPLAGVLGCALLMNRRREDAPARLLLAAAAVLALTPAAGWVLSGFSYETGRWSYALSLVSAMFTGWTLPRVVRARGRDRARILAVMAGYAVYLLFCFLYLTRWTEELTVAAAHLGLTAAALLICWKVPLRVVGAVAVALAMLATAGLAHQKEWRERGVDMLRADEIYADAMTGAHAGLDATDGARVDADASAVGIRLNDAGLHGVYGTATYNSTLTGSTYRFLREVDDPALYHVNAYAGLDGRAALEALWAVDRYLTPADEEKPVVPYLFVRDDAASTGENTVWKNLYPLPLATLRTSTLSTDDYAQLDALGRQWALLQAAVTDDTDIPRGSVSITHYELPLHGVEAIGANWDGQEIVTPDGGQLRLSFEAPADCELYLSLEDLSFSGGDVSLDNRVEVDCGGTHAGVSLIPDWFELSLADRPRVLIHLGATDEPRQEALVTFARGGRYSLSGVHLYAQPMSQYTSYVDALKENARVECTVEGDRVTCLTRDGKPGVLVFAIPAADGWRATVDGSAAKLTTSAGAFLALELPAGDHEIILNYRTPGLLAGWMLTLASALLLAWRIRKYVRKSKEELS